MSKKYGVRNSSAADESLDGNISQLFQSRGAVIIDDIGYGICEVVKGQLQHATT